MVSSCRGQVTAVPDRNTLFTLVHAYCANPNDAALAPYGGDIANWDVSGVTDMYHIFRNIPSCPGVSGINNWDVSSVTGMLGIFQGSGVDVPLDNWDVRNVRTFDLAFAECAVNPDISMWQPNTAIYLNGMFYQNTAFNRDISQWNVGSFQRLNEMFMQATAFNQNLNAWSSLQPTRTQRMFQGATSFNRAVTGWTAFYTRHEFTGTMTNMFDNTGMDDCNKLKTQNAFLGPPFHPYGTAFQDTLWYGSTTQAGATGLLGTNDWASGACPPASPPPLFPPPPSPPTPPAVPNVAYGQRRSNFEVCNAIPNYPQSDHYEVFIRNIDGGVNAWHRVPTYITSARAPGDGWTYESTTSKHKPGNINNLYGWTHSFAKFEKSSGSVEIKIVTKSLPSTATTRPEMTGTTVDRIEEDTIYLTLRDHGHLHVDVDEQFSGEVWPMRQVSDTWTGETGQSAAHVRPPKHAITIHALPMEVYHLRSSNAIVYKHPTDPVPSTIPVGKNLVYFTSGIHNHTCEAIPVQSDTQYYVACDAVLLGHFYSESASNVIIGGMGIVSAEYKRHPSDDNAATGCRAALTDYCDTTECELHKRQYYTPVTLIGTNNSVQGLTFVDTAYHGIMLRDYTYSTTVSSMINYVTFISWRLNSDGANPFNNVRIERSFFRTQDDSYYVGGKGIYKSIMWNDYNGAAFLLSRIGAMRSGTGAGPIAVYVDKCWVLYHRAAKTLWSGGGIIAMRGQGQQGDQEYPIVFRDLVVYDKYMTQSGIKLYTKMPVEGEAVCATISCYAGNDGYTRPGDINHLTINNASFYNALSNVSTSPMGVPDAVYGYSSGTITASFYDIKINDILLRGNDGTRRRRLTSLPSEFDTNPEEPNAATVVVEDVAPPSPPAPHPPPPPPPPQGLATQDPHLVGAHGEKMDFRGRHDAVYAILSVPHLTFSLRTQNATFIKPGYMPKLVHGSFFTEAFWKVTIDDGGIFIVNTSASNIGFDVVDPQGKAVASKTHVWTEFNRRDMRILYKQSTLVMRVAGWETNVTRKPVYNRLHGPEWRFDLSIRPLNGTGFESRHGNASGVVASHGILGQTWDGDAIAIDGAHDDYEHAGVEVWTKSMAEGGIEGKASEYELKNKFAHNFEYTRHDVATYTPPRDIARMTGTRRIGDLKLSASAADQLGLGYRR